MLLTSSQIEQSFIDYGIIAIGDSIDGVEGLIDNVAITLSSAFSYTGEKADPYSKYAFPRKNISNDYPDSFTPQCVYDAQLYILVQDKKEDFLNVSYNRGRSGGYGDKYTDNANGLYKWTKIMHGFPQIEIRVRNIMQMYISLGDTNAFDIKKGGTISNNWRYY